MGNKGLQYQYRYRSTKSKTQRSPGASSHCSAKGNVYRAGSQSRVEDGYPSHLARYVIFGKNACIAALRNPRRNILMAWVSESFASQLTTCGFDEVSCGSHCSVINDDSYISTQSVLDNDRLCTDTTSLGESLSVEQAMRRLRNLLKEKPFTPRHNVITSSQGIALYIEVLEQPSLEDVCYKLQPTQRAVFVAIDEVSDPQNVGAIIRSAVAFNATAIIHTQSNTPKECLGIMRASAGCFECIPYISVTNLRSALCLLNAQRFEIVGLDGKACNDIFLTLQEIFCDNKNDYSKLLDSGDEYNISSKSDHCAHVASRSSIDQPRVEKSVCFVLGSEHIGIRPHILSVCTKICAIPIASGAESLNVSNAAAIALYLTAMFQSKTLAQNNQAVFCYNRVV